MYSIFAPYLVCPCRDAGNFLAQIKHFVNHQLKMLRQGFKNHGFYLCMFYYYYYYY